MVICLSECQGCPNMLPGHHLLWLHTSTRTLPSFHRNWYKLSAVQFVPARQHRGLSDVTLVKESEKHVETGSPLGPWHEQKRLVVLGFGLSVYLHWPPLSTGTRSSPVYHSHGMHDYSNGPQVSILFWLRKRFGYRQLSVNEAHPFIQLCICLSSRCSARLQNQDISDRRAGRLEQHLCCWH